MSFFLSVKDFTKAVIVWDWRFAPEELRKLSTCGGDEDWVAFVPDAVIDSWGGGNPPWIDALGVCGVEMHQTKGGFVYIGYHS